MGREERSDGVGIFVAKKWVYSVVSVERHSKRVLILRMVLVSCICHQLGSCFMNKLLQMTKFRPSANSLRSWIHLHSYLHTQNHHASHHSQHYYFEYAHSYHQLTQPFHSEVYNSTNSTLHFKNSLFPPLVFLSEEQKPLKHLINLCFLNACHINFSIRQCLRMRMVRWMCGIRLQDIEFHVNG